MLADLFDPAFADSVARIAAPILLASLGGAICHRAGVFNIALEGFILMGAFAAVLGSFMLGHVFGVFYVQYLQAYLWVCYLQNSTFEGQEMR